MIAAIGWIGSAICVWSLVQSNQLKFRASNLAACVVLVVFNVLNGTWSGAILNTVVAVINVRQVLTLRSDAALQRFVESSQAMVAAERSDVSAGAAAARH